MSFHVDFGFWGGYNLHARFLYLSEHPFGLQVFVKGADLQTGEKLSMSLGEQRLLWKIQMGI